MGRIAPEEIEYLMARGMDEEEATATIVRGFLNVNIEGLPESLAKRSMKLWIRSLIIRECKKK